MRVTFGLASLSIVTGFCLVQACSSDDPATQEPSPPGGSTTSSSSSTSSSGGSTTSSGGSTTSSTSSSGGTDSGTDGSSGGKSAMTFFATSTGSGAQGGNLGGLAGADQKCTDLAKAVGGGDHTWAAYLSTTGQGGMNAKDRIGMGPWKNQKGVEVAKDVASLVMNGIKGADILDEKGAAVPTKEHDILTGTKVDGTANANNCNNWTEATDNDQGQVGHADWDTTAANANDRWSTAHNVDCDQQSIAQANGAGRIYCFAKD